MKITSLPNDRLFVIAEIGINHNGDLNIARQLMDLAKSAGCDAVKFQKRTIDIVYSPEVLNTPRESPWGKTTLEQKLGLEFNEEHYDEINSYSKLIGLPWFASAWDIPAKV
jgi:N-acetylneuraminate synthase